MSNTKNALYTHKYITTGFHSYYHKLTFFVVWYYEIYGWSEGGSCEYPRQKRISQNKFSIHKVKKVIKESEKAVYAEIEGIDGCHWIPLSCINGKEQIKQWFINKLKLPS